MPTGTEPETDADAAFAAFLARSEPALRGFLRRLCGSGSDADDVLQETLAKVWRLRKGFDPRGNGTAWLLQAAFRCFCDHRARRTQPQGHGDGVDNLAAPPQPCPTELRDEVERRLAPLSPLERALLLGFHAHGRSLKDLAAEHGLPLNTVKSHLHRARRRLQEER